MRRLQVDKGVKVFNVGDEFLLHVFKAHLVASVCSILKLGSVSEDIPHEKSLEWLRSTAERLIVDTLMPLSSSDPAFIDPTDAGLDKLCNSTWISDTLDWVETGDQLLPTQQSLVSISCAIESGTPLTG